MTNRTDSLPSFERLERRDLLAADLRPHVGDGPTTASIGEEIRYVVTVTNQGDRTGTGTILRTQERLDDASWAFDGTTAPTLDQTIELGPGESKVFTLTGRVPQNVRWTVAVFFCVRNIRNRSSVCSERNTIVLDSVSDESTVGVIEAARLRRDFGGFVVSLPLSNFHRAEPAGDIDADGIDDFFLKHYDQHDETVNGDNRSTWQHLRHTVLGATEREGRLTLNREDGEVLESWPENLPQSLLPDRRDGGRYSIGDVDGDGFEDVMVTNPRDLAHSGVARLLFGPDLRDNFVILGNARPDQPGADILFVLDAGPVGDINGDGFEDYYVADRYDTQVFYGRDFDRALIGDLDHDGVVTQEDFFILAENFGRDDPSRSNGDLDGDGSVSFSDFLIFSSVFGRTARHDPVDVARGKLEGSLGSELPAARHLGEGS